MGSAAEADDARRGADGHLRRPALPRRPADVDADWLTQVLAPSAPSGAQVVRFAVSDVGAGMGLLGRLIRYELAWKDGQGLTSVVVKLPAEGSRSRALAVRMAMYRREVGFYRDLGAASDVAVRCHHADVDERTQDFVLVLDDLTDAATVDQLDGCPVDRAAEVLTAVAGLHARHWDDTGLEGAPQQQRFGGSLFAEQLARSVDACWPDVRAAFGDELSPLATAIGDGLADALPRVAESLSRPPITLSHGDLRLDNVFFDEAAGVRLCDWQLSGRSRGARDVAYFLTQSLTPEVRRDAERDLVRWYLDQLAARGVRYDERTAWADYRAGTIVGFVYAIVALAGLDQVDARSAALPRAMLRRSATAMTEAGYFLSE